MSEQAPPTGSSLPDDPNLEWLRKAAKDRLAELRRSTPQAKLADAQLDVARQYGFPSWRALKAHIDSLTIDGQLFAAARTGDVATLARLLDEHPDGIRARAKPYQWTLLHAAAPHGAAVDLLLRRGLDPNAKEEGDNTTAMHWAAAAGAMDSVRRLADAGGDVVGHGDDHELDVIGWATCWDGCDDEAHHQIVDFLISRGARHHIFSAIAMNLGDEVRRLVRDDPSALARRMSRNENHQLPLHFALRKNRPEMVELLLTLGADPAATDGTGAPAALYAADPKVDRRCIEALARHGGSSLFTTLALCDEPAAAQPLDPTSGLLHMLAKRGVTSGVRWLLDRGADPNARWDHWGAFVTPLHLAAWQGHADVVRLLLDAGADPTIRDSMHDGDALGWAEFAGRVDVVRLLRARAS